MEHGHEPPRRPRSPLGRSLDIYHRDRARIARMDRLHAALGIGAAELAFDIGAHLGDRAASFLRLGARVVALEPQPRPFRALRLILGRAPGAVLLPCAAGAAPGEALLHVNAANPTVSTLNAGFISAAEGAPGWEGQRWDSRITVPVTTLDALIARHGRPGFVKIDVEGHEAEVLRGLSAALPLLSFEFTTIRREVALDCITRLRALGSYRFNYSLGEAHRLELPDWVKADRMAAILTALPQAANSGDVLARLD